MTINAAEGATENPRMGWPRYSIPATSRDGWPDQMHVGQFFTGDHHWKRDADGTFRMLYMRFKSERPETTEITDPATGEKLVALEDYRILMTPEEVEQRWPQPQPVAKPGIQIKRILKDIATLAKQRLQS